MMLTAFGASVSASAIATGAGLVGAVATFAAKKPRLSVTGSPTQIQLDPQAGIPYAIGRTMSPGWVVHREAHGATQDDVHNPFQSFVMVWSLGPIEAVEAFQVDRQTVTFNGGVAQGDYSGWMSLDTQLGLTPEPDALYSNTLPRWGAAYKISGKSAGIWALKFDKKGKKYAAGVPLAQTILKGVKVYDPRLDSTYPGGSGPCRALQESTYVWSENPWLHALTFALGRWQNGKRVMGVGMPIDGIDVAAFVEAANIADANGWKAGGVVSSLDDKWNVLKMMAQAGGGEPIRVGARLSCLVSAPRVSLATIRSKDIVGPASVTATQSRRDRINGIVPRIRLETHGWEPVPLNVVRIAGYVTVDGGERTRERDLPLVQQADQAAELAAYEIVNAREIGPISLPLPTLFMGYRPGDCLTLDVPEMGLNMQPAVALDRSLSPASGVVTLGFRSETPAKHDFALGRTGTPPPTPSLTPPDLSDVAAPSALDWTLTGETLSTDAGAVPALLIVGVVGNPSAEAVVFEYRPTGEEEWRQAGTEDVAITRKLISPVAPDASYEAAVSYRVRGVVGERLVLGPVGAGDLEVPWTGVTDPGDGSRPEDGATVGAPPGTPVGDRPAEQVTLLLDSLDASYALVVAAVEDAAEDAAEARDEADQVRSDLSAEILRAQAAEGAIYDIAVLAQTDASGALSQVTEAVTILTDANASLAARQDGLEASNDDLEARIGIEEAVRANQVDAVASRTTELESVTLLGPNSNAALRSAATEEATTRSSADSALSNRSTALESIVMLGPNSNAALRATATDEATTRATADTGLSNRISTVETATTTGPNSLPALRAAVTDEATARISAVGAVASRTSTIEASVGSAGGLANPDFLGLPAGFLPLAPGWAYWFGAPSDGYRYPRGDGRFGWLTRANAGVQTGLINTPPQPLAPGWAMLEIDWTILDGAYAGAGIIISALNSGGVEVETKVIPLSALKDNRGNTVAQGSALRNMVTRTLVHFTNATVTQAFLVAATNAALFGQGTPYKQIAWYRANLRAASPQEIEAGVALPALKATVDEQAGVLATLDGKLAAYWEVDVIAGGRARLRARADATGSAVDIAADVVVLGDQETFDVSAGRARVVGDLHVEGGNLIIRGTSHMKVLGLGFGVAGEFVEWYGPVLPSVAQCSRANGVSWETKAGAKKLGGFSIGQLVAGTTNPALAASVTASTGAFGSNGGIIQANASWYYRRLQNPTWPATSQGLADFIAAMQAYGATSNGAGDWSYYGALPLGGATTLQMRRNGSNVATQTVSTGTRTVAGREPEVGGAQGFATISDEATLSFTYTDPQQSTANRTYEAILTRHAGMPTPTEQTVSIGTLE